MCPSSDRGTDQPHKARTREGGVMDNPGSNEAIAQGCTCPRIDNHYGAGFPYGDQTCWYISEGCPLHAPTPTREDE
jgi:hypothetical protein